MKRDEWIDAFARESEIGAPSAAERRELLELAGIAAHASERTAAPLACWIAGRSRRPLRELLERAGQIAPPAG